MIKYVFDLYVIFIFKIDTFFSDGILVFML